MNLVQALKEIKAKDSQILALKTENQELKQRLFYLEYLTNSPEVRHELENMQKEIGKLRVALIAMKKENDELKKQVSVLKYEKQEAPEVLPTGKVS